MTAAALEDHTVAGALAWAAGELGAAGVPEPRRDARLLLAHVLDAPQERLIGYPERALGTAARGRFASLIARRARREPVARILGRREFWSLPLTITPDTLDPRPESETLVAAVLDQLDERGAALEILDLGTGSGCLLLALLSELPNARGLGCDLSPGALAAAADNAAALGLAGRARFEHGDWAEGLSGAWQVIVSNPPYIRDGELESLDPEVAAYEPRLALSGGADGLAAYRRLVPQAAGLLAPGGLVALEVGLGQAETVAGLLTDAGLCTIGKARDLAGLDRCLLARKQPG